jgi:polyisoprenoid-binding protein YceI
MKILIAAALAALVAFPAAAMTETYNIDPNHTFPMYEINHFGYSIQRGRFYQTRGKIELDLAAHRGSAEIAVDTRSVSTGVPKLDEHLQGEDFFNSGKYPDMTFKSNQLTFDGDNLVSASGDLTIAGVTRPVTFKTNFFHCGVSPLTKKKTCGADLEAHIKRSEFGIKYMLPGLGDDVTLRVNTEAIAG